MSRIAQLICLSALKFGQVSFQSSYKMKTFQSLQLLSYNKAPLCV